MSNQTLSFQYDTYTITELKPKNVAITLDKEVSRQNLNFYNNLPSDLTKSSRLLKIYKSEKIYDQTDGSYTGQEIITCAYIYCPNIKKSANSQHGDKNGLEKFYKRVLTTMMATNCVSDNFVENNYQQGTFWLNCEDSGKLGKYFVDREFSSKNGNGKQNGNQNQRFTNKSNLGVYQSNDGRLFLNSCVSSNGKSRRGR